MGFALFVSFIFTTPYAIGRVADRGLARAWLLLSLALFVILDNLLETVWMRGFSFLWVVFVIVAAEAGGYSRPFLPTRAAYGSRTPRPGGLGLSRGLRPLDSHKIRPLELETLLVQCSSAGSCDLWPVLCAARRAAKAASRTSGGVRDFDGIIAAMSVGRMPRMKWAAPSRFSGAGSQ